MATEITMPKLSDTMEQGTVLHWLKHEGDRIEAGDIIAEVETDKADMEIEAAASGVLTEIRVKEGEAAPVGAVLALLDSGAATRPAAAATAAAPPASAASAAAAASPKPPAPSLPPPAPTAPPPPKASAAPPQPAAPRATAPAVPPPKPAAAAATTPDAAAARRHDMSKLRATVARQMSAAKREIPHFYVTAEIDMTAAAQLRTTLNDSGRVPERITYTHLLIRALALTLPEHPRVNASWVDDRVVYHDDVNIGVAVAVEDGLVAPVVRGCQNLSLRAIARAVQELVAKAPSGRFAGDELSGGTFSISNMGMLDIEEFSAVITPPQAAVLAVGAVKERPVVREGQLAVSRTMRVTLSADHRVLNGVEAGRFLEDLKKVLENPVLLVMGEG